jgi:hypothetical protein
MAIQYNHISAQCQAIMALPNSSRVSYIHLDKWVNHSAAADIRNRIKSTLYLPNNEQAICMVIIGAGGAGKSSLLDRVVKDSDSWAQRLDLPRPYLQLRLSPEPTLKSNINSICRECGLPPYENRKDNLPPEVVNTLKARKVRILFIDEFNHLLAVSRAEAIKNLNFFKEISGPPMSLTLIGFGTHEAMHAIKMDVQLSSRFQELNLEAWRPNEEFRSFLASYERFLPLKLPSNLASKEIVNFLTTQIDPTTRNITHRIKWAAMSAILEGAERISVDILQRTNHLPDLTPAYELEEDV